MKNNFANDEWYLKIAMEQSEKAYRLGEVPVGAIIVDENGKVIGEGFNTKEKTHDPTGHAEIIAIKNAAKKLINGGVSAIIGGACPNITKEIAKEISIPKEVLMITPADNSNELINLKDNGFLFRTTPSKIRGSKILALSLIHI